MNENKNMASFGLPDDSLAIFSFSKTDTSSRIAYPHISATVRQKHYFRGVMFPAIMGGLDGSITKRG